MSNVCLIDFAEDELEAFLSGRSNGISTPPPEDGLQLLADVATATTDTRGSLPCHDVQVEFRPGLTGSDRVPAGPRPGTSRVEAGSEPGLGREYPWDQRPGITGSGRAQTGLEPGESRVKAESEPDTDWGHPRRRNLPCPFGHGQGLEEECQAQTGHEDLRRRARAGKDNRGFRPRRYRSSSSDGGSDCGRENPSYRNGQPANGVEKNRQGGRYSDLSMDGERSMSPANRRLRTPIRSGNCGDRGFRRRRYRSSSSDGGSDWGRENPSSRNGQPANCFKGNRQGRRCSDLTTDGERRPASPTSRCHRTSRNGGNSGERQYNISRRSARDQPTASAQPQGCRAVDSNQSTKQPGTSRERYGFTVGAKLGTYDGSTCLETFLARFDNCARYFKWNEEDKLFQLCASLSGPAGQILWDAGTQTTVSEVGRLLRNRFGNINQAERFRADLRARRRKPGEPLQKLYQDVCRLMALAYPGPSSELTNVVARDAFLDALDNNNLRIKILEREPVTLDEALKLAC